MNMKTTKFLAVLAVLAMAFAGAAVVASADVDDAANTGVDIAKTADYKVGSATEATVKSITTTGAGVIDTAIGAGTYVLIGYEAGSKTLAVTLPAETYTLYIPASTSVTITNLQASNTITVKTCTISDKVITETGISLTLANGTTSAVVGVGADAKTLTVGGTAVVSAGAVPSGATLKMDSAAKFKLTGTLTNDGTINNVVKTTCNIDTTAAQFLIDGQSAKLTATSASSKGTVVGTGSPLILVSQGTVEKQIVHATTYTDGKDSVIITNGDNTNGITMTDLDIYVPEDGHAITVRNAGTISFTKISFIAESSSGVTAENLFNIGASTAPTMTIKEISTSGINQKDSYVMLHVWNNKTYTIGYADTAGLSASIEIDSTVTSVRATHASTDLQIADNMTFEKISAATGKITVNAGKTLTLNGGLNSTLYAYKDAGTSTLLIKSGAKLVIGSGSTVSTEAGKNHSITVESTGIIENNGKLEIAGTATINGGTGCTYGTQGIIGTGTTYVKAGGELKLGLAETTNTMLTSQDTVVYEGGKLMHGTDGPYLVGASTDTAAIKPTADNAVKIGYVWASHASDFATSNKMVYDIFGEYTITDPVNPILGSGTAVHTANIIDYSTITFANTFVIPDGAVLNVNDGATLILASGSGAITNNGTMNLASADQVVKTGGSGKIYIAGEEAKKVDGNATAINTEAAKGGEVLAEVSTAITEKIDIKDSDTTLLFSTSNQTALDIKMSSDGQLNLQTTGNVTLAGTVDVNGSKVTFKDVKGNFQIVKGSVWISGDIHSGELEIAKNETLIISDSVIADAGNVTIILNDGSKVVFDGEVVTIGKAATAYGLIVKTKNADDSAKFNIEKGTTVYFPLTSTGGITIGENDNSEIKCSFEGDISVPGTLVSYKVINLYAKLIGDVTNNGTINLYTGADISNATITGSGKVVDKTDDTDMEDLIVTGESAKGDIEYSANQNVIVSGTWTLVKGAFITIKGALEVPEGSKLVIEPGAMLRIDNPTAVATIAGSIIVEDKDSKSTAAILTVLAGSMEISGTVTVNGYMNVLGVDSIKTASVTAMGGVLSIAKTGFLTVGTDGSVIVLEESELYVAGSLNATNIYNGGTVTINTSVPASGNSTIYMSADDAVVDIVKFTVDKDGKTLTISDEGLTYYVDKSANKEYKVGLTFDDFVTYVNAITIDASLSAGIATSPDYYAVVAGLKIVEDITSFEVDPAYKSYYDGYIAPLERAYYNGMDVSGDVSVSLSYVGTGTAKAEQHASADITLNGGEMVSVLADDTLYIGYHVKVTNAAGAELYVAGTLDADDYITTTDTYKPEFVNNGALFLQGDGIVTTTKALNGTINASMIEVGAYTIYTYVTIDRVLAMAAVDPTIDEITVYGKNTMYASATLPADVTMTLDKGATISVGYEAGAEVLFTIADDATLKGNGTIYVNGTMYANDQTDVKGNAIISDVKKVEYNESGKVVKNGWALWTNIVTALNTAELGDVITIARTTGNVVITASTEIKAGITLLVPEDTASLYLKNGVALTINGILSTEMDIIAEKQFDTVASNVTGKQTSAIVVNGLLLLPDSNAFSATYKASTAGKDVKLSAGAPIAGAYYKTEENNVISSLDVAMIAVDDIIGQITLNGVVKSGALAFVATDDCSKIVIGAPLEDYPTEITVNLALDGATIANTNNGTLTGTISNEYGAIKVAGLYGAFEIKDKNDKLTLGGTFNTNDSGKSISIASGLVYTGDGFTVVAKASTPASPLKIAEEASLIISSTAAINTVTVNGTLYVDNSYTLSISGKTTVTGSVVVAEATATKTAGSLAVNGDFYLGMKSGDLTDSAAKLVTSDAATLAGTFTPGATTLIFVSAGAAVDDAAQDVLDDLYKITLSVEKANWFTVYTKNDAGKVSVSSAPADNAQLLGWYNGTTRADKYDADAQKYFITIKSYDGKTLTADLKYDIYQVMIITDAGVKSVAIDNVELVTSSSSNYFITAAPLVAGTHKVTYTMKSGYEGTCNLYTMDHTILQNLGFTLSGFDDYEKSGNYYQLTLQLMGTEPIPEPEPEPTPTPEEKSEWTVTTILLCVLVVLIAIMAVIVALRLNRN